MGQLHKFGKKRRIRQTTIDQNHDHIYVLGKVRTKVSVFYDDLMRLEMGHHNHAISYDPQGNPIIHKSEGHIHTP